MFLITMASRIGRKLVSDRLKRLLLISSLFGFLKNKKRIDPVSLAALNAKFSLAYRPDAVELPIALNELFINLTTLQEVRSEITTKPISDDERRTIARRVMDLLPEWMKYSDETCLLKDIADTIDFAQLNIHSGI